MKLTLHGTLIALVCLAMLSIACAPPSRPGADMGFELAAVADSPHEFGSVGEFEFEERRGGRLAREDLLGEPWLVAFIFTRCATICPAMTHELSRAHSALEGIDAKVVAISIDPDHDTPEVLTEYASHFDGGLSDQWLFLSGDEESTYDFIRTSFKLGVERVDEADPGLAVSHSSMICAVDSAGKIRGYYNGTTPEGTDMAVRRVRYLAGVAPTVSALPTLNAFLNGVAALLLVLGLVAIKAGNKERHALLMRLAFAVSAAFLASYLYYHFVVIPSQGGPVRFSGSGVTRVAYLTLLLTHVLGAIINLPMVLRTFWLAHKERWEDHKWWAKRTLPLWLYVSVTGVLVYLVLYVF